MAISFGATDRGFGLVNFHDRYGAICSLQQSSLVGDDDRPPGHSAVWLGVDDADPKVMCSKAESVGIEKTGESGWQPYPIPDEVLLSTRMHLDRQQAAFLVEQLTAWLDTGEFKPNRIATRANDRRRQLTCRRRSARDTRPPLIRRRAPLSD